MKQGHRFLGIDDGPREVEKLIGVAYRGTEFIEQIDMVDQEPDTGESTEKILELYSGFDQYIRAIILDGISFNGFNIADIGSVADETDTPVIAITVNRPNRDAMRSGLEAAGLEKEVMEKLPEVHRFNETFIQFSGCSLEEAKNIIEAATLQGNIPESVRAAHLIGEALGRNQH